MISFIEKFILKYLLCLLNSIILSLKDEIMFRSLLSITLLLLAKLIYSQEIKGKILSEAGQGLSNVRIFNKLNDSEAFSTEDGSFIIANEAAVFDLVFVKEAHDPESKSGSVVDISAEGLIIKMRLSVAQFIEADNESNNVSDDDGSGDNDVYSLMNSSQNALLRASAFQFNNFRFNLRGLNYQWNTLAINGFELNDLEQGGTSFYFFSGQNQYTKYSQTNLGLGEQMDIFGSIGSNQMITVDPALYRRGLSFFYSNSNRNYTNRVGLHYVRNLSSSISLVAGINRRWAKEGGIPGTFYDSYGAYYAISKNLNSKVKLRLSSVYAPTVRGKRSAATKEVYQLAGDNLYNSYWGYQLGDKRNARVNDTRIPLHMFNMDWKLKSNLLFSSGVSFLKGKRSDSNIDWADGNDPRPDYYQKLPSYIKVKSVAEEVAQLWRSGNTDISQLDWESYYDANRNNHVTIYNANGITSNHISGNRAVYLLNERHADPTEFEHFSLLNFSIGKWKANALYRIELASKDNYVEASDLLGADFYVDQEGFIDDPNLSNPNVNQKNRLVRKGDRYDYNYISHQNKYSLASQWNHIGKRLDLLLGVNANLLQSQREGKWKNAIFDNTDSKSELVSNSGFDIKTAATFKINGRNYIQLVNSYHSINPVFKQLFINPSWSNEVIANPSNTKVHNSSLHYYYRSPELSVSIGTYFIRIYDLISNKNFFLDSDSEDGEYNELSDGGLITAYFTDWDQQNMGVEGSAEYNLGRGFATNFVISAGDFKNLNRPTLQIYDQFSKARSSHLIYIKEYFIPSTPQFATSFGIKYSGIKNGFITANVSYLDRNYTELNPLRRTTVAVNHVDRTNPNFHAIIDQEKLPSALTVDLFFFKSFRIVKKYCTASLGVNNVLNNRNLISGSFEQNRFDFTEKNVNTFPNRYFYLQGINYFLNLSIGL